MARPKLVDAVETPQDRVRELEESLGECRRLLGSIMDNAAIEVGFKDRAGRYRLVNRRHTRELGLSIPKILGKTAYDLYPRETADAIQDHDDSTIERGEPVIREIPLRSEDRLQTDLAIKYPVFDETMDLPLARGETILVLEDDEDVRALAISLLESLGYRVLAAPDGKSALSILTSEDGIDLLLSDVVLPGGMSGPQVAEQIKLLSSATRILFMSGYAETAAEFCGPLDGDLELLNKPFRMRELAQKVRLVLDA